MQDPLPPQATQVSSDLDVRPEAEGVDNHGRHAGGGAVDAARRRGVGGVGGVWDAALSRGWRVGTWPVWQACGEAQQAAQEETHLQVVTRMSCSRQRGQLVGCLLGD